VSSVSSNTSKGDGKKQRKSQQQLATEAGPVSIEPTAEMAPGEKGDDSVASGAATPPGSTDSTTEPTTSGAISAEPEPIIAADHQPGRAHEDSFAGAVQSQSKKDKKKRKSKRAQDNLNLELSAENTSQSSTCPVAVDETQPSAQSSIQQESAAQLIESEAVVTQSQRTAATETGNEKSAAAPSRIAAPDETHPTSLQEAASASDSSSKLSDTEPQPSSSSEDMARQAEDARSPYSLLNKNKKKRKKPKADADPWPTASPEVLRPQELDFESREVERMLIQLSTVEEETEPPTEYAESDGRSLVSEADAKSLHRRKSTVSESARTVTSLVDSEAPSSQADADADSGESSRAYSLKKAAGKKEKKDKKKRRPSAWEEPWPSSEASGAEELAETPTQATFKASEESLAGSEAIGESKAAGESDQVVQEVPLVEELQISKEEPSQNDVQLMPETISEPVSEAKPVAEDAVAAPATLEHASLDPAQETEPLQESEGSSQQQEPEEKQAETEINAENIREDEVMKHASEPEAIEPAPEPEVAPVPASGQIADEPAPSPAESAPAEPAVEQPSEQPAEEPSLEAVTTKKSKKDKRKAKKAAKEQSESSSQPDAAEEKPAALVVPASEDAANAEEPVSAEARAPVEEIATAEPASVESAPVVESLPVEEPAPEEPIVTVQQPEEPAPAETLEEPSKPADLDSSPKVDVRGEASVKTEAEAEEIPLSRKKSKKKGKKKEVISLEPEPAFGTENPAVEPSNVSTPAENQASAEQAAATLEPSSDAGLPGAESRDVDQPKPGPSSDVVSPAIDKVTSEAPPTETKEPEPAQEVPEHTVEGLQEPTESEVHTPAETPFDLPTKAKKNKKKKGKGSKTTSDSEPASSVATPVIEELPPTAEPAPEVYQPVQASEPVFVENSPVQQAQEHQPEIGQEVPTEKAQDVPAKKGKKDKKKKKGKGVKVDEAEPASSGVATPVEDAAPVVEEPAPAVEEPAPAVEEPAAANKEPTFAPEEPVEAAEETPTVLETPKIPAPDESSPAVDDAVAIVEQPTPSVEQPSSSVPAETEPPLKTAQPEPVLASQETTTEDLPATKKAKKDKKKKGKGSKVLEPELETTSAPVALSDEPSAPLEEPASIVQEPTSIAEEPDATLKDPGATATEGPIQAPVPEPQAEETWDVPAKDKKGKKKKKSKGSQVLDLEPTSLSAPLAPPPEEQPIVADEPTHVVEDPVPAAEIPSSVAEGPVSAAQESEAVTPTPIEETQLAPEPVLEAQSEESSETSDKKPKKKKKGKGSKSSSSVHEQNAQTEPEPVSSDVVNPAEERSTAVEESSSSAEKTKEAAEESSSSVARDLPAETAPEECVSTIEAVSVPTGEPTASVPEPQEAAEHATPSEEPTPETPQQETQVDDAWALPAKKSKKNKKGKRAKDAETVEAELAPAENPTSSLEETTPVVDESIEQPGTSQAPMPEPSSDVLHEQQPMVEEPALTASRELKSVEQTQETQPDETWDLPAKKPKKGKKKGKGSKTVESEDSGTSTPAVVEVEPSRVAEEQRASQEPGAEIPTETPVEATEQASPTIVEEPTQVSEAPEQASTAVVEELTQIPEAPEQSSSPVAEGSTPSAEPSHEQPEDIIDLPVKKSKKDKKGKKKGSKVVDSETATSDAIPATEESTTAADEPSATQVSVAESSEPLAESATGEPSTVFEETVAAPEAPQEIQAEESFDLPVKKKKGKKGKKTAALESEPASGAATPAVEEQPVPIIQEIQDQQAPTAAEVPVIQEATAHLAKDDFESLPLTSQTKDVEDGPSQSSKKNKKKKKKRSLVADSEPASGTVTPHEPIDPQESTPSSPVESSTAQELVAESDEPQTSVVDDQQVPSEPERLVLPLEDEKSEPVLDIPAVVPSEEPAPAVPDEPEPKEPEEKVPGNPETVQPDSKTDDLWAVSTKKGKKDKKKKKSKDKISTPEPESDTPSAPAPEASEPVPVPGEERDTGSPDPVIVASDAQPSDVLQASTEVPSVSEVPQPETQLKVQPEAQSEESLEGPARKASKKKKKKGKNKTAELEPALERETESEAVPEPEPEPGPEPAVESAVEPVAEPVIEQVEVAVGNEPQPGPSELTGSNEVTMPAGIDTTGSDQETIKEPVIETPDTAQQQVSETLPDGESDDKSTTLETTSHLAPEPSVELPPKVTVVPEQVTADLAEPGATVISAEAKADSRIQAPLRDFAPEATNIQSKELDVTPEQQPEEPVAFELSAKKSKKDKKGKKGKNKAAEPEPESQLDSELEVSPITEASTADVSAPAALEIETPAPTSAEVVVDAALAANVDVSPSAAPESGTTAPETSATEPVAGPAAAVLAEPTPTPDVGQELQEDLRALPAKKSKKAKKRKGSKQVEAEPVAESDTPAATLEEAAVSSGPEPTILNQANPRESPAEQPAQEGLSTDTVQDETTKTSDEKGKQPAAVAFEPESDALAGPAAAATATEQVTDVPEPRDVSLDDEEEAIFGGPSREGSEPSANNEPVVPDPVTEREVQSAAGSSATKSKKGKKKGNKIAAAIAMFEAAAATPAAVKHEVSTRKSKAALRVEESAAIPEPQPSEAETMVAAPEQVPVEESAALPEPAQIEQSIGVAEVVAPPVDEPTAVQESVRVQEPVAISEVVRDESAVPHDPLQVEEPSVSSEPIPVEKTAASTQPVHVEEPSASSEPVQVSETAAPSEPVQVEEPAAITEVVYHESAAPHGPPQVEERVAPSEPVPVPVPVEETAAPSEPAHVEEPASIPEVVHHESTAPLDVPQVEESSALSEPVQVDESAAISEVVHHESANPLDTPRVELPSASSEPVAVEEAAAPSGPVHIEEPSTPLEPIHAEEPATFTKPVQAEEPSLHSKPVQVEEPAGIPELAGAPDPPHVEEPVAPLQPVPFEETAASSEPVQVEEPAHVQAAAEPREVLPADAPTAVLVADDAPTEEAAPKEEEVAEFSIKKSKKEKKKKGKKADVASASGLDTSQDTEIPGTDMLASAALGTAVGAGAAALGVEKATSQETSEESSGLARKKSKKSKKKNKDVAAVAEEEQAIPSPVEDSREIHDAPVEPVKQPEPAEAVASVAADEPSNKSSSRLASHIVETVNLDPAVSDALQKSPVTAPVPPTIGLGLIPNLPELYPPDAPSPKLLSPLPTPQMEQLASGQLGQVDLTPAQESSHISHDPPFDYEAHRKKVRTEEATDPAEIPQPVVSAREVDASFSDDKDKERDHGEAGPKGKDKEEVQADAGVEDDAAIAAAASALTGGVSLLAEKFGSTGKKKKKGKQKKSMSDKGMAEEEEGDLFDDPALWEGTDRKPVEGSGADVELENVWGVPAGEEAKFEKKVVERTVVLEEPAKTEDVQPEKMTVVEEEAGRIVESQEPTMEEAKQQHETEDKSMEMVKQATEEASTESQGLPEGSGLGRMDSETIPRSLRDLSTPGEPSKRGRRERRRSRTPSPEPVQRAFSFPDDIADEEAFTTRDVTADDKEKGQAELAADQPVRLPPLGSIAEFMRSQTSLPPVQEEVSDEEPANKKHTRPATHGTRRILATPDAGRDSGFGSDSPRVSRHIPGGNEGLRDSGVHLRESMSIEETPLRDRYRSLSPKVPPEDERRLGRRSPLSGHARVIGPETPRLHEPSSPLPYSPEPEKLQVKKQRGTISTSAGVGAAGAATTAAGASVASLRSASDNAGQTPRPTADGQPRRMSSNTSMARLRTPEPVQPVRPDSPGSLRSYTGTPPLSLRRMDKRASGDLRSVSLSQQDLAAKARQQQQQQQNERPATPLKKPATPTPTRTATTATATGIAAAGAAAALGVLAGAELLSSASKPAPPHSATPVANEGRVRAKDMTDVFVSLIFFFSFLKLFYQFVYHLLTRPRMAMARAASARRAHRLGRTACAADRACRCSSSSRASNSCLPRTACSPKPVPRPSCHRATAMPAPWPSATPKSSRSSACCTRQTRSLSG
jgi:hypothetical protein